MSYDIEETVKSFDENFDEFIMPYLEQHGFKLKSRQIEESIGSYQFSVTRTQGKAQATLCFRFCNHHYDLFDGIAITLQSTSVNGETTSYRLNDILGDGNYKRYSQLNSDKSLKDAAQDIRTHFGKYIEQIEPKLDPNHLFHKKPQMNDDNFEDRIKTYSLHELHECLSGLDEEKFPERKRLLVDAIKNYTNTADNNLSPIQNEDASKLVIYAPFWRRFVALLIDMILLAVLGAMIGISIGHLFWDKDVLGRLIGLVISGSYFAYFNSAAQGGQTFGKRLLKIKVVNHFGDYINIKQSLLRYSVIAPPLMFNHLILPMNAWSIALIGIIGGALFGVPLANLYLFIFNRRTKQLVHDIIGKTIVLQNDSADGTYETTGRTNIGVSLSICTVIFIAIVGLAIANSRIELPETYQKISKLPDVYAVVTSTGTTTTTSFDGESTTRNYFTATVRVKSTQSMDSTFANKVSEIIKQDKDIESGNQIIRVVLIGGYNLGIWSSTKTNTFTIR